MRPAPPRGPRTAGPWLPGIAALLLAGQAWSAPAAGARAEMRGTALESGTRRPLTGAVATLHADAERGAHYLTSTDPSGRFVFQGLPPGSYSLEVSLAGYRTARKDGLDVRPPFRSIIEVILPPGPDEDGAGVPAPAAPGSEGAGAATASLTVTLTDQEQRPVPEGQVVLVSLQAKGERRVGRSDEQGRLEFEALPAQRYRLTASAPGFLTVRTERLTLGGETQARVAVTLTPFPLEFGGNLEDLLPPEEPLPPERRNTAPGGPSSL